MANTTTGAIAHTFTFSAHALRVIMRDGNPWFVASDVCAAIGIKNYRDSVERLDDDEKGVALTDTLGGAQEMLIVNESGLNAIILRSRDAMTPGTPAHKYRKWVTAEVLPAIRKTGRYVAPAAAQPERTHRAAEQISAGDHQSIQRMVWFISRDMYHEQSWVQAVWFYLRQCLDMPTPARFTTDQLPRVAQELGRAMAISRQVGDICTEVERQATRRIFRKGEDADTVMAALRREALAQASQITELKALPSWLAPELRALALGTTAYVSGLHYTHAEQPDFFTAKSSGVTQ